MVNNPSLLLEEGVYKGYEFCIIHNGRGYRCGYFKVTPGHPYYGKDYSDLYEEVDVHGGLTFADKDYPCGRDNDDGWWLGFDCAHSLDAVDTSLPGDHHRMFDLFPELINSNYSKHATVKDNDYVRKNCFSGIESALRAEKS